MLYLKGQSGVWVIFRVALYWFSAHWANLSDGVWKLLHVNLLVMPGWIWLRLLITGAQQTTWSSLFLSLVEQRAFPLYLCSATAFLSSDATPYHPFTKMERNTAAQVQMWMCMILYWFQCALELYLVEYLVYPQCSISFLLLFPRLKVTGVNLTQLLGFSVWVDASLLWYLDCRAIEGWISQSPLETKERNKRTKCLFNFVFFSWCNVMLSWYTCWTARGQQSMCWKCC